MVVDLVCYIWNVFVFFIIACKNFIQQITAHSPSTDVQSKTIGHLNILQNLITFNFLIFPS